VFKRVAVLGAVCAMFFATAFVSPASARMIDRVGKTCGHAVVTAKFQQEELNREVDVEMYSTSRGEKWRVQIREANGPVLHRMTRTTGRDAAFDVARYVPSTVNKIDVRISGPSGQACSIRLASR
jgi:hypothetical protein